jgi:hypothetical protein
MKNRVFCGVASRRLTNGYRCLVSNEGSAFLFRIEQSERTASAVLFIRGEDFILVKIGKCVNILKHNFFMIVCKLVMLIYFNISIKFILFH